MFRVAFGSTVLGLYLLYVKGEESEAFAGSFFAVLVFAPPSAFPLCFALVWFVGEKASSLSELDLKLSSSLIWRGRPPGHDEAAHMSGYSVSDLLCSTSWSGGGGEQLCLRPSLRVGFALMAPSGSCESGVRWGRTAAEANLLTS